MTDFTDSTIATTIDEIKKWRKKVTGTVGFIPTMGYLHEGHISLIKQAKKENDHVVMSIFVNPKQFGPKEDFTKYPRDTSHDLQLLKTVGVDIVFLPLADEIYPSEYETNVSVTKLSKKLEGRRRPNHFNGVTTIVLKLFNIIQPERAYFGQKDAQQVVVIKKMVSDLQFPIKIIVGDTLRETDGLAMSSRNVFLNKKEREEAAVLFESLQLAQELFRQGEHDAQKIKDAMQQLITKIGGDIDYISIADSKTLDELKEIKSEALVSLAVYYGKIRLIDNCLLKI